MSEQLNFDFSETPKLSLDLLPSLCEQLDAADLDYKAKKKESDLADKEYKRIKQEIIDVLDSNNLKSFKSNVGTVSVVNALSFATPKTVEQKEEFFKYIESKFGEEAMLSLRTVNSRSLNSFLNEQGETEVPGIGMPSENNRLSFRRS